MNTLFFLPTVPENGRLIVTPLRHSCVQSKCSAIESSGSGGRGINADKKLCDKLTLCSWTSFTCSSTSENRQQMTVLWQWHSESSALIHLNLVPSSRELINRYNKNNDKQLIHNTTATSTSVFGDWRISTHANPMSKRPAKFDAASFMLGGEICNHTNKQTNKNTQIVNDISTPCYWHVWITNPSIS